MFDIFGTLKDFIERIKHLDCCCDDNDIYNETFYNPMPPRTCYNAFIQK